MKAVIILGGLGLLTGVVWLGVQPGHDNHHLLISEAVATPLKEGRAAAFLELENTGKPDRLIGVESPVAQATLYSPEHEVGPPVPVGESAPAPDSAQIRLDIPRETFANGAFLPLTLTFTEVGEVTAKAKVADRKTDDAAEEVGRFGIGDLCVVGEGEPAPSLTLLVAPEGDGWRVLIEAAARHAERAPHLVGGDAVMG